MREFIAGNKFKNEEVLSSLEWYFESKNTHLKQALLIQTPMSNEDIKSLRINYSHYFVSLMSGLEMLLDSAYSHKADFKKKITQEFIFDGYPEGYLNYLYIRELRNCIVHRGYDLTSSAHTPGGHPLLLAPETIPDKWGKKEFLAFGKYILEIVTKIEERIGEIVYSHIQDVNLLKPTFSIEEQLPMILKIISKTPVMPDWAKDMALDVIPKLDLKALNSARYVNLERIIKKNVIQQQKNQ